VGDGMKISELQDALEMFKLNHGEREIEFREIFEDDDPRELELHEVHDGYNVGSAGIETVCEIRLIRQGVSKDE
jgi:hypothetical protein